MTMWRCQDSQTPRTNVSSLCDLSSSTPHQGRVWFMSRDVATGFVDLLWEIFSMQCLISLLRKDSHLVVFYDED